MTLADVNADELAQRVGPDLNIGLSTVHRITAGKRQPRPWEIPVFSKALGIAEEFLTQGPSSGASSSMTSRLPVGLEERLAALGESVHQLLEWAKEDGERLARIERHLDEHAEVPPARRIDNRPGLRR